MCTIIAPKEITFDPEAGYHVASFSYYDGIEYALTKNLKQTTSFSDVFKNTHYLVCCGDVMVRVGEFDFPELERRVI